MSLFCLHFFSGAKDMVAENVETAVQEASKKMIDAYASQTRAQLNIHMDAPIIVIPISSKNRVTFLADLGKNLITFCFHFRLLLTFSCGLLTYSRFVYIFVVVLYTFSGFVYIIDF